MTLATFNDGNDSSIRSDEPAAATYAVRPSGVIVIALGVQPGSPCCWQTSGTAVPTCRVASAIGMIVAFEASSTYPVVPSGVIAIARGAVPGSGIGAPASGGDTVRSIGVMR